MRIILIFLLLAIQSVTLAATQCGSPDKGYMIIIESVNDLKTKLVTSAQVFNNGVLEQSGNIAAMGMGSSKNTSGLDESYVMTGIPTKKGVTMSKIITSKDKSVRLSFGNSELNCTEVSNNKSNNNTSSASK